MHGKLPLAIVVSTLSKSIYKVKSYSFFHLGYFYSTFSSPLLLRGPPDYSIDTVSELTCWSALGNFEWRTCPRSLRGL